MRRIQFIELHEQPWFPSSLRDEITDALQFGLNLLKAYAPIAPLVGSVVNSTESRTIVDLCSGGGGPWLGLYRRLQNTTLALHIWLTDKYPNLGAFQSVRAVSESYLTFYQSSVDAMKVPPELKGFRTIFSAFHHFSPEEARAILQDAVDASQSIGIFEITRRAPSTVGLMFPWALMSFVSTPFIRPFRWSRLLWTYLVPSWRYSRLIGNQINTLILSECGCYEHGQTYERGNGKCTARERTSEPRLHTSGTVH